MIVIIVYYLNIIKCWKNGVFFDFILNLKFIFLFLILREKKFFILNYFILNFEIDFVGL